MNLKPTSEEIKLIKLLGGKVIKIWNSVEDYQKEFPGPFPKEPAPKKLVNIFELL